MPAFGSTSLEPAGVELFPSDEPGQYFYIPRVMPEVAPDGSPAFLLIKTGGSAVLQAGTRFTEDPVRLEKALAGLKARQDVPIPLRLSQAPLEVRDARLVLAEGDIELAKVTTSGIPPFAALFHITLNGEQAGAMEKASAGTRGKVRVFYDFDLTERAGANAAVQGDVAGAAADLGADATEEDAAAWVEGALGSGLLKLDSQKWGVNADGLLDAAIAAAKSKAAVFIRSIAAAPPPAEAGHSATVLSTIRLEEPRKVASSRAGDVADWFTGGRKLTVLTASATVEAPAATSAVTVRLGFDDKDAPIAFIEVRGEGDRIAVMRAPAWQPVIVNAAGKIALTVHYTTSAPPLATSVATTGNEKTLAMEELGIALVRVDAAARKSAGAAQLSLEVKYVRNGEEVDSWPVRFRFGDWTEQWFMVTSAPGLNGSLEYRWQETHSDGSTTAGGPITTDQPTIRID